MKSRVWTALSLLSILAVAFASAQNSLVLGRLDIPFKFMVGEKEMPLSSVRGCLFEEPVLAGGILYAGLG
jgi:hypothetical protein